jgi:hypothetical protein
MSRPRQLSKNNYFILFMPDTFSNSRIEGMLSNEYPIRRISTTMWKFSDEEAEKLFEKRTKKAKAAAKLSKIDFSDWNQINDFIQDGCEKLNWEYVVFLESLAVTLLNNIEPSLYPITESEFREKGYNLDESEMTDEMKFIKSFFLELYPRIKGSLFNSLNSHFPVKWDLRPTNSFNNDVSIIIDMYKLYCERTQDNDESELSVCRDIEDRLQKEGKYIREIRHDFRGYNQYFRKMEEFVDKELPNTPPTVFERLGHLDPFLDPSYDETDHSGASENKKIIDMGDCRISTDLRIHLLKTCYQEALKFIS